MWKRKRLQRLKRRREEMKLSEYQFPSLKILLMGPSGSGKTCLATTLGEKATIIDLDGGLASALTLQDKFSEKRKKVEVKECWQGDSPLSLWRKASSYISSWKGETPVLIVDSLTNLAQYSLGAVLQGTNKWDLNNIKNVSQPEWGVAIAQIERLFWKIRTVPSILIMIAHTARVEVDGKMKEVLSIYGAKLPQKLMALFDEAWFVRVEGYGKNVRRVLQTTSSTGVECKTRRQLPDGTPVDEGMEKILQKIGVKI